MVNKVSPGIDVYGPRNTSQSMAHTCKRKLPVAFRGQHLNISPKEWKNIYIILYDAYPLWISYS